MKSNLPIVRALFGLGRRAERRFNQMHSHDYGDSAVLTVRDSPVLGGGRLGTVFDPYAVDLGTRYRMYVSTRSNSAVGCFESRDGIVWSDLGTALRPSCNADDWDSRVNRACVLAHGHRWLMWYTGQRCGKSAIGIAASQNGVNYERLSAEPVLIAEEPFEGVSVMNPCVLPDDSGGFRMWYAAGEDFEPDVVCEAVSLDGIHWEKKGPVLRAGLDPYDRFKVGGCHVLRLSKSRLLMFYIGYQNVDVARVCLAVSNDNGSTWVRSELNPLISPARGWRSCAVYKPTVLASDDGLLRIWFNARSKDGEMIGLAESKMSEVVNRDKCNLEV